MSKQKPSPTEKELSDLVEGLVGKRGKALTPKEADKIAIIRTLIILFYILTNLFIIAGVIRHW
jgi:hypothetical protein